MLKDKLRLIILNIKDNENISSISNRVGCNKSTISRLYPRIIENISKFDNLDQMTDSQIADIIYNYPNKGEKYINIEEIKEELKNKHVNKELLYDELIEKFGEKVISRSTFYKFCSEHNITRQKPTMVMTYKPGELMQVDWAGAKFKYFEGDKLCYAHTLIFSLPWSGMVYAEPFKNERIDSFLEGHINAFNFFQGAPLLIRPDNLKVGVIKPDKYSPLINEQYLRLCQHYNVRVSPTRVASPRDKGTVENTVKSIYTWIYGYLRNEIIDSYDNLKGQFSIALNNFLNRDVRRKGKTRFELFELEKPFLQKLPSASYNFYHTKMVKIAKNYHIEFDSNHYSVPYRYADRLATLKFNSTNLEIYIEGLKIAEHIRSYNKDISRKYITLDKHKAPGHKYEELIKPSILRADALKIGSATAAVISKMLDSDHNSRQVEARCRHLLNYAVPHDKKEIEDAFNYIFVNGITPTTNTFKTIFEHKLYK
jgi:hypothetical protein